MNTERKNHWETVYETKRPDQVSWTQEVPTTSLDLIRSFDADRSAAIIDIGGGDSLLVDCLLDLGFENVTVLDISAKALQRAQVRLGDRAANVQWIVSDITAFAPQTTYDIWHDRATFHFLTEDSEIQRYLETARKAVTGYMVLGTFSDQGPQKCSGLEITQYNEKTLTALLENGFDKLRCLSVDHITPFDTIQNFLFCSFKRHRPGAYETMPKSDLT